MYSTAKLVLTLCLFFMFSDGVDMQVSNVCHIARYEVVATPDVEK